MAIGTYDPEIPISSLPSGWRGALSSPTKHGAGIELISAFLITPPCSARVVFRPVETRPWDELAPDGIGGYSTGYCPALKMLWHAHGSDDNSSFIYGPSTSTYYIYSFAPRQYGDEGEYEFGTSYKINNTAGEVWPSYAKKPKDITDNPSQMIMSVSLYYDGDTMKQVNIGSYAAKESLSAQVSDEDYGESVGPYRLVITGWQIRLIHFEIYGQQIITPRGDVFERPPGSVALVTTPPPKTKGGGFLPAIQR